MTKRGDLEGWIERNSIVKTVKKAVDDMMPILIIDEKKWKQYEEKMELENAG